ncbi:unnamed protein product [marine sediment metagenome]|uniref:Phosphoadenosine phosphosulphate reductase domain-containing protein n=1 Tax=marine sediment metagenome TaxID=412755 RepID=X1HFN5_9ZZZZ
MSDIKHIVSFSGGKDSTAMLLRMIDLKMPIDEVRYFDCGSWEFPEIIEHILSIQHEIEPIKFKRVYPVMNWDIKKTIKGMPSGGYKWCSGDKINALHKGLKKRDTIFYLGFGYDEKKRFKGRTARHYPAVAPLIAWKWTEKDCLDYCYSKGFTFGGLYKYFNRVSCWCCFNKNAEEKKMMRIFYPYLWKKYVVMYARYKYKT